MTELEKRDFLFEIEERAAIREYDGKQDRKTAERCARVEVAERWRKERDGENIRDRLHDL